jgi:hypothetical protein
MQSLVYIQSIYFFVTALWPIIDIKSFYKITGVKKDTWLVKTVSLLILSISMSLFFAACNNEINNSIIMLCTSSAGSLLLIDAYYVMKGKIHPVYLLDACIEAILILFWFIKIAV